MPISGRERCVELFYWLLKARLSACFLKHQGVIFHAKNAICSQINIEFLPQYVQGCESEIVWMYYSGMTLFGYSFSCVAEYFTISWQFMSQYFVCLGAFYFISIISFSVLLSEDPEFNLSSSGDSHTPQRQPPRFWLNDPIAAVPSVAKCCTILHVFSHPILLQQFYCSSSEQACLPPPKEIIYITVLQRKHNHCFLWKTQCQGIMEAICFSSVSIQTMWVEWREENDVWGRKKLVKEMEWAKTDGGNDMTESSANVPP